MVVTAVVTAVVTVARALVRAVVFRLTAAGRVVVLCLAGAFGRAVVFGRDVETVLMAVLELVVATKSRLVEVGGKVGARLELV